MSAKTGKGRLTAELRRQKALELRLQGFSLRQIAQVLGVSPTRVHHYLMQLYERTPVEDIRLAQRLAVERLEAALPPVMNRVKEGDLAAVDRLVRIVDLLVRIQGGYQAPPPVQFQAINLVWPDEG